MKESKIVAVIFLLIIAAIAFLATSLLTTQPAEASEIRRLLEKASGNINAPQPGQIAHYTYHQYYRMPPVSLEPVDPYHLSYEQIWSPNQVVESWIEIAEDGTGWRWRTQVFDTSGALSQDLLFENSMETDYFPLEGTAYRFSGEANAFQDGRIALIEDFLDEEELTRREGESLDGEPVLSVYTEPILVEPDSSWVTKSVAEALLTFERPFVSDLDPISRAIRVDFDPDSLLPVGHGEVVWDKEGDEYVISYRTFVAAETLTGEEAGTLFRQEIPESAFRQESANPLEDLQLVTGLSEIVSQVDYAIYVLPDSSGYSVQAPATMAVPTTSTPVFFNEQFDFGTLIPVGVRMQYMEQGSTGSLLIIQGPGEEMTAALKRTRPTWIESQQQSLALGPEMAPAWQLIGVEATRKRYIIEADETMLFLDARDIDHDQLISLIAALIPADE